jgi:hypothetical protein
LRSENSSTIGALLTGEWHQSAGIKGKLLSIAYGHATVSRAEAQLGMTGELQQDRRRRLTFWRIKPAETTQSLLKIG